MVFFLECVAACVLFTAALEALAAKRREVFVNDYPPVVTEKLRALGIVAEKPPARKSDIIRKLIAVVAFALVSGAAPFQRHHHLLPGGADGIPPVAGGGLVRFPGGGHPDGALR